MLHRFRKISMIVMRTNLQREKYRTNVSVLIGNLHVSCVCKRDEHESPHLGTVTRIHVTGVFKSPHLLWHVVLFLFMFVPNRQLDEKDNFPEMVSEQI